MERLRRVDGLGLLALGRKPRTDFVFNRRNEQHGEEVENDVRNRRRGGNDLHAHAANGEGDGYLRPREGHSHHEEGELRWWCWLHVLATVSGLDDDGKLSGTLLPV